MIDQRACARLLGVRFNHWPTDWPCLTGGQFVLLRALLRSRPNSFVGACEPETGIYRVIVLRTTHNIPRTIKGAREYVLLPSGVLRHVAEGEPYHHHREDETHAA